LLYSLAVARVGIDRFTILRVVQKKASLLSLVVIIIIIIFHNPQHHKAMDESTTVVVDPKYMMRHLLVVPGIEGFLPLHIEVMIVHFSLHELPALGCMFRRRLQRIDFAKLGN
jgi:hypothetical protein